MCEFSGKNFDVNKTVQYSNLLKKMAKKYESSNSCQPKSLFIDSGEEGI